MVIVYAFLGLLVFVFGLLKKAVFNVINFIYSFAEAYAEIKAHKGDD